MTSQQLFASISADLAKIATLCKSKNTAYGTEDDAFYNFDRGATLVFGEASFDATFRTLMAYASKHIVTLAKPGAILLDPEFEDRCLDVALYMLIARAMKKEITKIESEEPKNA